ncbi:MAG TPA: hypothetical protein VKY53_04725 [Marinobacter sp.]|nr:hypothetical protein [Marinobacter sp.]
MPEAAIFHKRRRPVLLGAGLVALIVAFAIAFLVQPQPLEERFVRLHAQDVFGKGTAVTREPLGVQATLLDYQSDPLLLLKAQAALHVFPEHARLLLHLFGEEPEFRRALRAHGEYLIPPAMHFYQNPVGSIEMLNRVSGTRAPLTAEERAWYAINFANQEGQNFTGQFVVAPSGEIEWIWTERITEGIAQFFTGGIRTLESRYRTDQSIRMQDIGWAAVDVVMVGSAVRLLKAGRASAQASRAATVSGRSAAYGTRLARAGRMASVVVGNAKWPAMVALGYMVVRHPVLLNDLFAGVAGVLGVPPWMVQLPAWFLILLPLLLVARWLVRTCLWLLPGRGRRLH